MDKPSNGAKCGIKVSRLFYLHFSRFIKVSICVPKARFKQFLIAFSSAMSSAERIMLLKLHVVPFCDILSFNNSYNTLFIIVTHRDNTKSLNFPCI